MIKGFISCNCVSVRNDLISGYTGNGLRRKVGYGGKCVSTIGREQALYRSKKPVNIRLRGNQK